MGEEARHRHNFPALCRKPKVEKAQAPERKFVVHVSGYKPEVFLAKSASKAKYKAFRQLRDSGSKTDFHSFMIRSRVEKCL